MKKRAAKSQKNKYIIRKHVANTETMQNQKDTLKTNATGKSCISSQHNGSSPGL